MTGYGGRRTQAQRDAITVEIGYALLSAAFAAAVLFGAVAGPALLFQLPDTVEKVLLRVGLLAMPVLFIVRVVSVLIRFPAQHGIGHTDGETGRPGGQPSQPGRTSPDS
ncbi:DUF6332 family protein [Streptomyces sp. ID05-47C]|uniref:DUF6332 family protein n=1 Tax=Streptomyces sp. ID05-47C TaxID=3028665 RepID=UPI0029A88CB7|nr:DUF6332 family protein [Streptomyces sp. ID05-47C]MDX3569057.1 DUF6332 family protein [Streptomyces sp. ID05-47C]